MTPLDVALAHLRRFPTDYLFPLKGKSQPLVKKNLSDNCSNDPEQIKKWAKQFPGCIYGIALRRSRLLVADVDVSKGKPGLDTYDLINMLYSWPSTERVRSPSGGTHCYYIGQHVMKVGGFGPAVDSPNYVVCPGMLVKDGVYRRVNKLARADAEPWMYQVLGRKSDSVRVNAREAVVELDQPHNVADAIHWIVNDAPRAVEGDGGEYQTMKVAMMLHDFGISEDYALQLMLDHYNEQKCDGPWEYDGLKQKVANGYAYASMRAIGGGTAEADFANLSPEPPHVRDPLQNYTRVGNKLIAIMRTPRAPRKKKVKS
jgi:hypothetical protein